MPLTTMAIDDHNQQQLKYDPRHQLLPELELEQHVKLEPTPVGVDLRATAVALAASAEHADYADLHQIFGNRLVANLCAGQKNQIPSSSASPHLNHSDVPVSHHYSPPSSTSTGSASSHSSSSSSSPPPVSSHVTGGPNDNDSYSAESADPADPADLADASKKRYPCPECGKMFGRVSHVRRHQLLHTGDKPFRCSVCGDRFTRLENRDRHMIMHTKVRPYNCEQCGKGFTQLNRLKVHRLTHTGERPFTCSVCSKRFLRVDHLRVHMRTHSEDRSEPDEAAEPAESAETEAELPAIVADDDAVAVAAKLPESQPPLVCCAQPAPQSPVQRHPLAQLVPATCAPTIPAAPDKPYQCADCPKQFSRRDHFARHCDTHSGERPHRCDLCRKQFSRKDNKYSHMVGCLLKNYGVHVDCGGLVAAGGGQLQRVVDERVREALGDAWLEPETQLHELDADADGDGDGEVAEERDADQRSGDCAPAERQWSTEREACVSLDLNRLHRAQLKYEPVLSIACDEENSCEAMATTAMNLSINGSGSGSSRSSPLRMAPQVSPNTGCFLKVRDLSEIAIQPRPAEPEAEESPASQEMHELAADSPANEVATGAANQPAHRCDQCDRSFQHRSHLVRHLAVHSAERPFHCDQCDKAFSRKEHLQRHVIVHTGIKPFRCAHCDRAFVEQHQQRRHMLEEHAALVAAAAQAQAAQVQSQQQLQAMPLANGGQRRSSVESGAEEELTVGGLDGAGDEGECMMESGAAVLGPDGLYQCDRCPKRYPHRQRLWRHYQQHSSALAASASDSKPHQCDYCEQRFSRTEHKRRHMAIHTNEKRFECEFCERRFLRADHMLAHVKTHEGVLPYKCSVCAQRFASAREKKEHMRRHTGAYRCEMCLERFESFGELSEHRSEIHLQVETQRTEILVGRQEHYPCPVCKKYFSIVRLGDHLKAHVAAEPCEEEGDEEAEQQQRRRMPAMPTLYADGQAFNGGGSCADADADADAEMYCAAEDCSAGSSRMPIAAMTKTTTATPSIWSPAMMMKVEQQQSLGAAAEADGFYRPGFGR